jgi:hypothetical protein
MRARIVVSVIAGLALAGTLGEASAQARPPTSPPAVMDPSQPAPSAAPSQGAPAAPQPRPAATQPGRAAAPRVEAAPQAGGVFARPTGETRRCREQALRLGLRGLARQRYIKRCRTARRAAPPALPGNPGRR